jgi:hypothetical protein
MTFLEKQRIVKEKRREKGRKEGEGREESEGIHMNEANTAIAGGYPAAFYLCSFSFLFLFIFSDRVSCRTQGPSRLRSIPQVLSLWLWRPKSKCPVKRSKIKYSAKRSKIKEDHTRERKAACHIPSTLGASGLISLILKPPSSLSSPF